MGDVAGGVSSREGRSLFPKDGKWSKKISSLRLMTSGRRLRRSASSSMDYRMTWWNMKEWKRILKNILMLWYSKKGVLMLMSIRKTINHSKACSKCRIVQMSLHNLRKHMVRTR